MFFKKSPKNLYIDLGSYNYKYLVVDKDGKKLGIKKLPSEIVKGTFSNIEIDFEKIKMAIDNEFKDQLLDIFLLCSDQFTKLLYMDIEKRDNIKDDRDFTIFRIKKNLDKSISKNVFIDYREHIQDENSPLDKNKTHLNIFLASEKLIKSYSNIFNSKNYRLKGINSTSSAIINSIIENKNSNFLLMNLGYEATTLSFVNHNIMFHQKVIEIGGKHFLSQISNKFNMTYEEAVKKLEEDFMLPNLKIDLEKSIKEYDLTKLLFTNLIDEISITIKFHTKTYNAKGVGKIYLTGGLSLIPGIDEFLSAIFDIEVVIFELEKDKLHFNSNMVALAEFL